MMVRVSQKYNGADLGPTEFAFYINRGERRSRDNVLVHWAGAPTSSVSRTCIRACNSPHGMSLSIPIPLRTCIRADLRRDPQRQNGLNVTTHSRRQPPLLIHGHTALATTGLPANVALRKLRPGSVCCFAGQSVYLGQLPTALV
jgi:hypothetical protein